MRHDLLHHHLSSIQRWLCCWRMVGKQMNRFTDIDPDAGDKAWDRIKERDLEEWVERRKRLEEEEMKTRLIESQVDLLLGIIESYREGWKQ
jgi:hypothetical protein